MTREMRTYRLPQISNLKAISGDWLHQRWSFAGNVRYASPECAKDKGLMGLSLAGSLRESVPGRKLDAQMATTIPVNAPR